MILLATEFIGLITKSCSLFKILIGNRFFLLFVEPFDIFVDILQVRRLGHSSQPYARPGFIDHIDGFVWQASGGDVAFAHLHGRCDRIVGDLYAVVLLVTLLKTLEDLNRFVFGCRFDDDFLETTSKCIVFLDVLAVLIKCRRTDALDLSTSQSRFQHVGSIDRTFGTPCTDQGVQFIDKQDRVSSSTNFVHHRLDAFFKLTTVLGARDHHGQVQNDDSFLSQNLWDFTVDNPLSKSFNDGSLAHTGFTQ